MLTWASRLVLERRATRILIVSDSADQRAVDARLADEVRRLQATITCTEPVEISADSAGVTHRSGMR